MKLYVHEYEAHGSYEFPFDMLRYDRSFPAKESEVAELAPYGRGERFRQHRTVTLRAIAPKNWFPTEGRWNSFGWRVSDHRVVTEAS